VLGWVLEGGIGFADIIQVKCKIFVVPSIDQIAVVFYLGGDGFHSFEGRVKTRLALLHTLIYINSVNSG
jgi:hypothetical protein